MALRDIIQWETQSGPSRVIGDAIITPQSQALTLHTPVYGFVWNRPVSVVVERADGVVTLPIVDVTRLALIIVLADAITACSIRREEKKCPAKHLAVPWRTEARRPSACWIN
jgi:hypothetical protein